MAIIQSQIPCGSLFVEKYEYSFSISLTHEDSISVTGARFLFHKISPIITNYGVQFSVLVYPNYYEIELIEDFTCTEIQTFIDCLQPDTIFTITRTDKSCGDVKILFENYINIDTVKSANKLFCFAVLNSIERGKLRYNDYSYFRTNFGPYSPYPPLHELLRAMFAEYINCRELVDRSLIRLMYWDEPNIGRYDYIMNMQMNIHKLTVDAFTADYCGTLHELLLGMLFSLQSIILYKNAGEIFLLPLQDDGSESYEINGAHVKNIENCTQLSLKRCIVGFHSNTYMENIPEPNYTNKHWTWWSPLPHLGWFDDFGEVTRFTHGTMFYCPFPLCNLDSKYNDIYHTDIVQDLYRNELQCIAPGKAFFLNATAHYDAGTTIEAAFLNTFNSFLKTGPYLRVTLQGLDYPLEKLFVLETNLGKGNDRYRCFNYSLDIQRNVTEMWLRKAIK